MKLVRDLRTTTGVSIKECHKAVMNAAQSDADSSDSKILSAAQDYLRKAGARFLQGSERSSDAGIVSTCIKGQRGCVIRFTCETDFVARSDEITEFVSRLPRIALEANTYNREDLLSREYSAGTTVESTLNDLAAKFKEHLLIKDLRVITSDGSLGYYVHNQIKHDNVGTELAFVSIDSTVEFDKNGEEICKNIGMHIVGTYTKPICVELHQIAEEVKAREHEIAVANTKDLPEERRARAIEGYMNKQLKSLCLLSQPYIKDDSMSVSQYLNGARVLEFVYLH